MQLFAFVVTTAAEEKPCQLQTLGQMGGYMKDVILKRFPDAQFSNDGVKITFQGDFHDASFYQDLRSRHSETVSRFFTTQSGVGGSFSIDDMEPLPALKEGYSSVQQKEAPTSSLTISNDGYDDGYFKELKWSVSVPRFRKLFSAYVFYMRGTPKAFLDELIVLSRVFGSCQALETFVPIDEARAIEFAKTFAAQDAVASEIIQHDSKVLERSLPGRWDKQHEIVFRGGCCCACDGECDDIIVRMTSDGGLVGVKVKHWVCGGRNKRNVDNQ